MNIEPRPETAPLPAPMELRDYLIAMSSEMTDLSLMAECPAASALFAMATAELRKTGP